MTNEQREAIKYLKESVLIYKNTIPKMSNTIDTVLSLIKEQQEEMDKKDKQIDLMARAFKQDVVRTVEEIKQYFEREVKDGD